MNSLQRAAQAGNLEQVEILLSQGIDANSGRDLRSPLVRACEGGFVKVVKVLLEAGADPYQVDETGQTAVIHLAQMDLPWEKAEELKELFRECALTRKQVEPIQSFRKQSRSGRSNKAWLGWSLALSGWAMTLILGFSLLHRQTDAIIEDSAFGMAYRPDSLPVFLDEALEQSPELSEPPPESEESPERSVEMPQPGPAELDEFRHPSRRPHRRPRSRPRPPRRAVANFPGPDYPLAQKRKLAHDVDLHRFPPPRPPERVDEEQGVEPRDDFRPPAPYRGEQRERLGRHRAGDDRGGRRGPGRQGARPGERPGPGDMPPHHPPRGDDGGNWPHPHDRDRSPIGY